MVYTYLTATINGHWRLATEKNKAILPVFADFQLSFSPLSKRFNTILSRHTTAKTDSMTFFDFQKYFLFSLDFNELREGAATASAVNHSIHRRLCC